MLPPKGAPNFKFSVEESREGNEPHALSAALRNMVKGRASAREIILWIEESLFPVHGMEVTLTVVVQTLLDIGSKSFTHLITVLERYGQVIAKLCADQDKQVMLITEIDSYWKNNAQMTAIAIDRMMGYRLLSNLAIVRWVFSPENIEQFHISDRSWEVFQYCFYLSILNMVFFFLSIIIFYMLYRFLLLIDLSASPPTDLKKCGKQDI